MKTFGRHICLICTLSALLAGCGPYLGRYQVDDVDLVEGNRLQTIDPVGSHSDNDEFLVRVAFSSTTNLEAASEGGDLYVVADFCPFSDGAMYLQGPFYDDKSRYMPVRVTSHEEINGKTFTSISSEMRQPKRDTRTGRYNYTAYLFPDRPKLSGQGLPTHPAYDIRSDKRNICVRLQRTGYFITKSVSDIFVIPRRQIAAAIDRSKSKRAPEAP